MIVAAATCDCAVPMIDSVWLTLLGVVAVAGPAIAASVVRHRRRRRALPADDPPGEPSNSPQMTFGDS